VVLSYTRYHQGQLGWGKQAASWGGGLCLSHSRGNSIVPTYSYLHGFASSPASYKGSQLSQRFADLGLDFHRPDLNAPSFETLTYSDALAAIDSYFESMPRPLRFVGSSMGGYLACRWAEIHPGQVDRMVLLCPGFRLTERWPDILGVDEFDRWRESGTISMEDPRGSRVEVHWGFIKDASKHPAMPDPKCPVTIVHRTKDIVVPIKSSRQFALQHADVRLVEVEDDHGLASSIDLIFAECRRRFEI